MNNYNQEFIKEDEEMEHEINLIGGYLQYAFLNIDEYEQQVAINQISNQHYEWWISWIKISKMASKEWVMTSVLSSSLQRR